MTEDLRRKKILYRAMHRGTKESDHVFGGFIQAHIEEFTEAELDELERILEFLDPDVMDWLYGRTPVPEHQHSAILTRMLDYAVSATKPNTPTV